MDTKKMRWVSGNSVIEMSYIMPLFFSLFVIIIHTVFYYHDKAIIGGAAAESAVMGAQYVRRYDKNYDIEAFFQEKIAVCAPVFGEGAATLGGSSKQRGLSVWWLDGFVDGCVALPCCALELRFPFHITGVFVA